MDKYNLTFNGEILPGQDLAEVKARFAKALAIDDPSRVALFFSGKEVTLRQNLDKSNAEAFYTKMYRTGAVLKLVALDKETPPPRPTASIDHSFHRGSAGNVEQSWPVRSPIVKKPSAVTDKNKRGNAVLQAEALQRKQAEELAATLENKKRLAAERVEEEIAQANAKEMARLQALEEKARQKAAEEAAKKKAAEELARKKAAKEAAKKKAAEELARKKAAKEAARQKNLKLAAKKEAAAQAARLRTELAEQKRLHAKAAARARADEKRIEDKLRALAKTQQTESTAQAATLKKKQREEVKQKAAESAARARREKQTLEQVTKQQAEEQREEQAALDRAAEGSARLEKLKNIAHVKKPLSTVPEPRPENELPRRQPGAPNLFSLKPFRNTAKIRQRVEKSQQLMKAMFITSVATLLALLILSTRYALLPTAPPVVSGPGAVVVGSHSGLVITAGEQLFLLDRSGVDSSNFPLSELGVSSQANLLGFDAAGQLVLQQKQETADGTIIWSLLSCKIETRKCQAHEPGLFTQRISSYIVDSRTGETYLASAANSLLSKLDSEGKLLRQVKIDMPAQPTLVLHEGLLYMNSAAGPAVSIYRPDNKGFGEQLDEVLLLPAPALEKKQSQIGTFAWSANSWWVAMKNPDKLEADLYRFDANWNFLSSVALTPNSRPEQLVTWVDKVLVFDSKTPTIQRFNSQGQAEIPLTPLALQSYIDNAQHSVALSQKLWHASLGFLALVGIGSYLLGRLHQLRSLVYSKNKVRGAEPVDDKEKLIRWIDPQSSRSTAYKKLAIIYSILCFLVLAVIFSLTLPAAIMLAATLLLAGPATALALLWTSQSGHIGVLKDQLILVDQHNMYHIDGGSRVHYRNNFLLLDDIVVFIGTRRLPVFSTEQLAAKVVPLALAGIKVDRKTVVIKLIQSAHPIAKGLYACAAGLAAAIMCLLLY